MRSLRGARLRVAGRVHEATDQLFRGFTRLASAAPAGVSNYEERHLRELLPLARIRPACNQFECHPRLPQRELRAVCHELGVVPVAYSSLGCGKLLAEPLVTSLARAEGRTPAQLLLKWGLQSGLAVLPKSVHPERIRDAAEPALLGWELAAGTMAALDGLSDGHHYCWDPSKIP